MVHRIHKYGSPFVALLFFVCLLAPHTIDLTSQIYSEDSEFVAEQFLKEMSECTTGLAGTTATPDGRPLLWKNRDVGNGRQEYHYKANAPIPFIGLTYSGDTLEYYAGLNVAGFAIENSDASNLMGGNPGRNGWGFDPDDGEVMNAALSTCTTVEDFQKLLDSLNVDGRTNDHNYGVFDAFGGASMFEVDGYTYARYDAIDSPGGWLVRSNYSYSGQDGMNWNGYSAWRHNRAYELFKEGWAKKNLTVQYLTSTVLRDLKTSANLADYAIPYDNYYNGAYGILPHGDVICRSSTRSSMVAHGVAPGQRVDDGVVWAMVGNPIGGIFTPLWARAGSTPEEFDNPNDFQYARLCGLSKAREDQFSDWNGVNTLKLRNAQGTGYWDYVTGLESWMFRKVELFMNSPNLNYDNLRAFQNTFAKMAADSIENWTSPTGMHEIAEPVVQDNAVILAWGESPPLVQLAGRAVTGYIVYRSAEPFREAAMGVKIATVNENRYVDSSPLRNGGFYRVEAVY